MIRPATAGYILVLDVLLGVASGGPRAWVPPSELRIEGTLEVLQGGSFYPSAKLLCGPVCLYMGAKYLGVGQHSLDEMARMVGWDPSVGTTLAGLETGCVTMGLRARSLHFREVSQLERVMRRSGALAIINDADHYYLIMKVSRNGVLLMSTTLKPEWIPARKLAGVWDGKALLFSRQPIRTGMGQTPMRLGACLAVLIAASMLTHRHLARRRLRRRSDLPE